MSLKWVRIGKWGRYNLELSHENHYNSACEKKYFDLQGNGYYIIDRSNVECDKAVATRIEIFSPPLKPRLRVSSTLGINFIG